MYSWKSLEFRDLDEDEDEDEEGDDFDDDAAVDDERIEVLIRQVGHSSPFFLPSMSMCSPGVMLYNSNYRKQKHSTDSTSGLRAL